jgi:hypothetical protein
MTLQGWRWTRVQLYRVSRMQAADQWVLAVQAYRFMRYTGRVSGQSPELKLYRFLSPHLTLSCTASDLPHERLLPHDIVRRAP